MSLLVLLVEPDDDTANVLAAALREAHHSVNIVTSAYELEQALTVAWPDMIVLERQLTDVDGFVLIPKLSMKERRPFGLMLIERNGTSTSAAVALHLGADDYQSVPVNPEEFIARIGRIYDRMVHPPPPRKTRFEAGPLVVDLRTFNVTMRGKCIHVTKTELLILTCLLEHEGEVTARSDIGRAVWGLEDIPLHLLDVHIGRLRRKIVDTGGIGMLRTVRRQGFQLVAPEGGSLE